MSTMVPNTMSIKENIMSNLAPFNPGLSRTTSRQLARSLSTLDARTRYDAGQIESAAELQGLRVDAIEYVGHKGLTAITRVTRLEETCATMAPGASGRLALVADGLALSIAQVVNDTARRVR